MQKGLCLIKLGGSVITDTSVPKKPKPAVIKRLLREIYEAKKQSGMDVIIGHGGGSFPHITASRYQVQKGLVKSDSRKGSILTLSDARELNAIVIKCAAEIGMPAFPFSPSSFTVSRASKIKYGFTMQIKEAMAHGFIPVVYGDVGIDSKQGVCIVSTEEILRFLSCYFKPSKVIFGTDVDGVFDRSPSEEGASLIKELNMNNISKVLSNVGTTKKVDVTGGMKLKASLLYDIINTTRATGYIANATKPGIMKSILQGKPVVCTTVKK